MRVLVLVFGALRELVGSAEQEIALPDGATAGDVVEGLRLQAGGCGDGLWGTLAVAVNESYSGRERTLEDGDVVALLPPVSGG